jgi:hypothetical protein
MKNVSKLAIALMIFAGAVLTQSCKRCVECEFSEAHGDHSHDSMEKKCGSKKEREAFEKEMAEKATAEGKTVHCHEDDH